MSQRGKAAIAAAEEEYFEKVWYYRHRVLSKRWGKSTKAPPADVIEGAHQNAERIKQKYPDEALDFLTEYDIGMLEGKLSALRWVMGDDWDELST